MFRRLSRTLQPVFAGAGCMIALLSAMNALVGWSDAAVPRVGDIIVFGGSAHSTTPKWTIPERTFSNEAPVIVETPGGDRCALDPATMRRVGGSIVVESRAPTADGPLAVRWAGERTSDSDLDCGGERAIILDKSRLDSLRAAALQTVTSARLASSLHRPDGSAAEIVSP